MSLSCFWFGYVFGISWGSLGIVGAMFGCHVCCSVGVLCLNCGCLLSSWLDGLCCLISYLGLVFRAQGLGSVFRAYLEFSWGLVLGFEFRVQSLGLRGKG